jgi:hypothetical protein
MPKLGIHKIILSLVVSVGVTCGILILLLKNLSYRHLKMKYGYLFGQKNVTVSENLGKGKVVPVLQLSTMP